MLPFERDLYVDMLVQKVKKEEEERKKK